MTELKKCCCKKYTNCRPCDIESCCVEKVDVSFKDVVKKLNVTVKVTGLKRFKIRLKITSFLIAIACRISGLNYENSSLNCEINK